MENTMGYKGVWVIRAMGLEGVDCIHLRRLFFPLLRCPMQPLARSVRAENAVVAYSLGPFTNQCPSLGPSRVTRHALH